MTRLRAKKSILQVVEVDSLISSIKQLLELHGWVKGNDSMTSLIEKLIKKKTSLEIPDLQKYTQKIFSGSITHRLPYPAMRRGGMANQSLNHSSISTKIDGNRNKKNLISNISENIFQGVIKKTNNNEASEDYAILTDKNENRQEVYIKSENSLKFNEVSNEISDAEIFYSNCQEVYIKSEKTLKSNEVSNGISDADFDLKIKSCDEAITAATSSETEMSLFNSSPNSSLSSQQSSCSSALNISSKRRRISTKKDVSDITVEKIIDSLNKPIVLPPSSKQKEKDSIDFGLEFVASIIRKITDEKEQDKLMSDIISMVMSKKIEI